MEPLAPFSLAPYFSPRPWGATSLRPWYPDSNATEPIGEAWLTGPESRVETGPLTGHTLAEALRQHPQPLTGPRNPTADYPLLIKLIFPTDKLSIQVHPDDAMARRLGHARGKTECWYILHAEPGAYISLGLRPGATPESIRTAILTNTLEDWLVQVPVATGDLIYVEAGTVHAINPGVVVFEVQQQSDLTYRMYDYGRPRELHIDCALEAMRLTTPSGRITHTPGPDGSIIRIANPWFTLREHHFTTTRPAVSIRAAESPSTIVLLEGEAAIHTPGLASPLPCKRAHAVILPAQNSAHIQAQPNTRLMEVVPGPALFA